MREGWEYKKLGEVCCPKNKIQRAARCFDSSDKILYIDISSIDNTMQKVTDITSVTFGDAPSRAQQKIEYGDIVVSTVRPNLKNIAIIDRYEPNIVASSGFCVLRNTECIERNYLFHYVTSDIFTQHLMKITTGANYPAVRDQDVRDSIIPLPPKSTQLAIVSELDKINELIRLKKEQLKDFDNLAQSLFYEMFGDPVENEKGWEVKKIGDLALVKTGPFGSMLHKEDYICDGIPLVNPVHMKDFKIVPDLDFTISKEKASELENYLLKSNDVVFARRGDIGRCAIVSEAEQGFICGTGSLFVRFSKEIESIFIMYIIRCDSFSKHLISKAKGATMLNINSNTIADLRIPLPPLSLQRLFAQRIEQIEREKSEVQKSIQDLETLLASRMQYWFE